ncbi:transposase, partial [Cellulosilyticum ruminicola]|uniref:transposase n=1 Tax=Cellulosilyticum ruminicola TaxID=425254 RepID=UPI00155D921A
IIQNNGEDIDSHKRQLLHWNFMITNISKEILNTFIITELYRIRWQIELLFKVVKNTFSLDKMHVGKTKYVEAILYKNQGRGVSMQRFYALLLVDLSQFYTLKRITLHTYETFSNLIQRIGRLALHEKRLRQTTYSKIECYLE